MRNLTIDPDIAQLIGATRARDLETGPVPAVYRCHTCRRTGRVDDGEALAAGADVHPGAVRLWFIHRACGPAQIIVIPEPFQAADEITSYALAYALTGAAPGRAWACLVVELAASLLTVELDQPHGDTDPLLDALTATGMHPTIDPVRPPAPEQITWRVQLPRGGRGGGVYGRRPANAPAGAPARIRLHEPMPPIPPTTWMSYVAAQGGRCGLFVASRAGLPGVMPDRPTDGSGGDLLDAMAAAGRAGRLVGTVAAVTR